MGVNVEEELVKIHKSWADCSRKSCPLSTIRKRPPCLGEGVTDPTYLVVVDAPNLDHMHGNPLGDEEFQLLSELLDQAKIPLDDIFITSAVACTPFVEIEESPGQKRIRSRAPSADMVKTCRPRLMSTIYALDPRVILAFGDDAWKTLVATKDRDNCTTATMAQGRLFNALIPGIVDPVTYPTMAFVRIGEMLANPSTAMHAPIARTLVGLNNIRSYVETLVTHEEADLNAALGEQE